MKWWGRAGALVSCIAIVSGGLFAWRAHRQRLAESGKLYELRARVVLGEATAEEELGKRYFDGAGVPKDYAEAIRWFQKSADRGDTRAETALGHVYFYGKGVPQDDAQAFAWYRKAAEQGYSLAQQALGWMYFHGRGVSRDYTQAAAWYQKAADQGDAFSQATLGYMNAYGLGVEKDSIGSLRWYRMAAVQGEPSALRYLKSLQPPTTARYFEVGLAMVNFFGGVLFALSSWELFVPGRKLRDWRQPFEVLLSTVFFASSGLCLYASEHVVRYLPFHTTFYLLKRALPVVAVIIVLTVVLPAKKKSSTIPESTESG